VALDGSSRSIVKRIAVVFALLIFVVIFLVGRMRVHVPNNAPTAAALTPETAAPAATPAPSSKPAASAASSNQEDDKMSLPDLVKKRLSEAEQLVANETLPGCYRWFNGAPVVIRRDGTMGGGPFTGRWNLVTASATRRTYTFTWPEAVDTLVVARDQKSLAGSNQYGYTTSGTRISGGNGLIGVWRWPNGVPVNVLPDGTFTAATFHGRWKAIDASNGIYTLTWPSPVDSVTLSADGSSLSGTNQYGVAISGVRTLPCSEK
jgi:hypothetical protein